MNPKAQRPFLIATATETYAVLDLLLVSALEFGNGLARECKSA